MKMRTGLLVGARRHFSEASQVSKHGEIGHVPNDMSGPSQVLGW